MTHSPSSAQSLLSDERIDFIANDGMRNAAGGIYSTRVYEFARAIESEVRAAASAQASGQADSSLVKLFDALMQQNIVTSDESYLALKCVGVPPTETEFVRAVQRTIAATPPSPDAREAGGGVTLTDEQREELALIECCKPDLLLMHIEQDTNYDAKLLARVFELAKDQARALLREAGSGK